MIEKSIIVGPFQCNCRLLVCSRTGHAVLVDPGDEKDRILQALQSVKTQSGVCIQVKYLIHTHGHLDHVGATRSLFESFDQEAPQIALHRDDEPLYLNLKTQGSLFGLHFETPLPVQHYLQDEEQIQVGDLKFTVLHTPGHSPGSVCLRLHEDSQAGISETVLTGDTLFQGSVGRTDLWGADTDQMFKSIRERLLVLDDETRVCPGHGVSTSIGIEKFQNPFLRSIR